MPPLNDKKLDKIQKLLEIANEDFATPEDVIKMSEALINVVVTEKEKLEKQIENNNSKSSDAIAKTVAQLTEKENGLRAIITRLSTETNQAISDTQNTFSKEIKRVERKIPTRTDLSGLEREISAIKDALITVPTEITANPKAVRDALELLSGDERLDKSAIKGLEELIDDLRTIARTSQPQAVGVRLLRYLSDVNIEGITDGQTLVWDITTQRFIPGTSGTGGGHTIQDEGTPLTQRTNLNFVGAGVTVTDDAGNDATVVTISGGGGGAVDSVNGETGVVVLTTDDISDTAQTNKWATASEKTKLSNIAITQPVDLDVLETNSHVPVTVTDSSEINFTLTGQDLTANIIAGSIDESKLDVSTNASLDLADTAVQPAGLTNYFNKTVDDTDDITVGTTNKFATTAEKTKLGHISVTQAVDLDAIEASSHAAVTVTDSTSIDLTLTGQDISAQREALTGAITAPKNSNTTALGSFTKAQLDTAVSDGNIQYVGDAPTAHTHLLAAGATDVTMTAANLNSLDDGVDSALHFHATDRARANHSGTQLASTISDFTEAAQDATGAMVATSIVYNDAGATLQRAALTGAITASQDSNATSLGSFTRAQLDTAVSDGNVLYVGDVTTNATHTGEVTGSGALTVDKTAITNKTNVTAAVGDSVLISDVSDTDNLKKVTIQSIVDLAGGGGNTFNDIYIDQSGGTSDTYGVLAGTINGSNALFTVSQSVYATGTLKVWLNGQLMTQGTGEDFVETTPASGTFTFNTAPASGSLITVEYQKVVTNSDTIVTTTTITELAQDATGAMAANSTFVSLTYSDATPSLTPALSATGTPSATTFLRGDNTWATPAGGGGASLGLVTALANGFTSI